MNPETESDNGFDLLNMRENAVESDIVKSPRDTGWIDLFCEEFGLDPEDRKELAEYIEHETGRMLTQKWVRVIGFLRECKLPKAMVVAVLATGDGTNMVEIAKKCKVSKQAVHKAMRSMEPAFHKYGRFYTGRRQFKIKPNGETSCPRPNQPKQPNQPQAKKPLIPMMPFSISPTTS